MFLHPTYSGWCRAADCAKPLRSPVYRADVAYLVHWRTSGMTRRKCSTGCCSSPFPQVHTHAAQTVSGHLRHIIHLTDDPVE